MRQIVVTLDVPEEMAGPYGGLTMWARDELHNTTQALGYTVADIQAMEE